MKRALMILGMMLIGVNLMAESYPVKFGPTEKGSRYSNLNLLGKSGTSLIVYRNNLASSKLLKFSSALAEEISEKVDFRLNKRTRRFEGISLFNDKIILFTSLKDNKTKMKKLYYDIYSTSSLIREKSGVEIVSYKADNKLFSTSGGFDIYYSEDQTKLGVIIHLPYDRKANEKFEAVIFDEDFNQMSRSKYTLPVSDKKMSMGDAHLSNNGDFFVAATEYLGEQKLFKPSKVKRHIYQLVENEELVDHLIEIDGKYIYSYTFKTNEYDDLILAGLYSIEGKSGVRGTFYLRFDSKENEIDVVNSEAFSENFITQGWSERSKKKATKKKKSPVLYSYILRSLVTTDDGGALLVGEQYYTRTRTYTTSSGGTRTVTYYYYNDIIVSRLDENGEFKWNKKVRKYQISTNDGGYYSSFAFHHDNESIYIMYNDNIKNYDEAGKPLSDEEKMVATNFTSNKKNVTSIVTIDIESGELKKEQLFNKKETGTIAVPKKHFSYKEGNKLYFYTKRGKNERVGEISFD